MSTITKLYPLFKDIGPDDKKSQKFIEKIADSYHSEVEQEIKKLVTNETLPTETTKLREEMANMKAELIKWNVGTIIVIAAVTKLIG